MTSRARISSKENHRSGKISRGDDPPRCRIPEVLTPIKRATEIIVHVVRKPDVIIDPSSRAERVDAEEN